MAAEARLVAAVLAAALLMAGCGGGGAGVRTTNSTSDQSTTSLPLSTTTVAVVSTIGAPSTTRPITSVKPTATTGTPTTLAPKLPKGDDLLARHDAPPDGVPAQLAFGAAGRGGFPCDSVATVPTVKPDAATYTVGDRVRVCVNGFDPSSPGAIEVSAPDGRRTQYPLDGGGPPFEVSFVVGLTKPTGAYGITAVQGPKIAKASFVVGLPEAAFIEAIDPSTGSPGSMFRFVVVTPSAGQSVSIDLYRTRGSSGAFVTSVGAVTTDSTARASFGLPTTSASPVGDYCLVARPFHLFPHGCAFFTLR